LDPAEIIRKHFPEWEESKLLKLARFADLIVDWNTKINLISRKDITHVSERHILHSLSIARHFSFAPGTRLLDVGTGGGFPGIPLAIVFPDARFTLIDSIGKKTHAVTLMIRELELRNAEVRQVRVEDFPDTFDFVLSRAVMSLEELFKKTSKNIDRRTSSTTRNGLVCLKGGDLDAELKQLGRSAKVISLADSFPEKFFETKKIVYIPVT
jgi:16S rRNA (guanine527-N7)-methyltransferase